MEPDYVKLKEIKPALAGYIRESQVLLGKAPVPDDVTVHDVRVFMKRSRAVMKLIAGQTGSESFDRNYGAFREVGRILCSWRESSVHRKTLKDLRKKKPGVFAALGAYSSIELLMRKNETPAVLAPGIIKDLETINDILTKSGFRIRFQSLDKLDAKQLLDELNNTYMMVAEKYLIARNNTKPENLHEFRKRAKDFLYQLYFFRPLNPPVVKALEKKLDALTQGLGKYNDLAQLIKTLGYKYSAAGSSPALDELILIVRQEQDKYLSKVWPLAYKIFCPGQKLVNILGFRVLMI